MIVDEVAFVDRKLLFGAALPLAVRLVTGMVLSSSRNSSPGGENLMDHLKNTVDENGDSLFKIIHFQTVCDKCIKTKGPDAFCPHLSYLIPPHQSTKSRKILSAIYPADMKDVYTREILNIETTGDMYYINRSMVKKLRKSKPIRPFRRVQKLFMGIDPNGGGPNEMGISIYGVVTTKSGGIKRCVCFFPIFIEYIVFLVVFYIFYNIFHFVRCSRSPKHFWYFCITLQIVFYIFFVVRC